MQAQTPATRSAAHLYGKSVFNARSCWHPMTHRAANHGQSRVATRAIKLYTNPGSRGKMCEWYLAELGIDYQTVNVDMRSGKQKSPEYLAINPFGKLPALVDDDMPLFESGAIVLHLANKYGKLTNAQLAQAAQWVLFANSTFSEAFFFRGPSSSSMQLLAVIDGILAKNTYISGETFGPGDVALAGYLLYLPLFFPDLDLKPYPNVFRYMKDAAERPACPPSYKEGMAAALARQSKSGGLLNQLFGAKN